ncbi:MAG TPA: AMP-binding protein [Pseudolabrys sp.]|nr:AMP-binding protein [Pseudolabrys sp.]
MSAFPLIAHSAPDSVVAWRDGKPITARRFLCDVVKLRAHLPAGTHMLNACADRYCFTVGLAAAMTSGRISLHPSTTTPATIRQLLGFAPDAFCLTDSADCAIALPQTRFPTLPDTGEADHEPFAVPHIDGDQVIAYVFTSGSSGEPVPHRKTWGLLVRNVRAEAVACGLTDGRHHAVVGTVPPQHMYGFESTVLMVMQSGNAIVAGPAFFPVDIAKTAASAPAPRVLVSTPLHLRSLIASDVERPAIDLVMSASAPLPVALAEEVEARLDTTLLEIYGSTETGQIAFRRTTQTDDWTLFPDVRLTKRGEECWASEGHVEAPCLMQDVIELVDDRHFRLHGRMADMVNIAGKRSSLGFLNHQLTAIPGVVDGAFVVPDDAGGPEVPRLAALAVAPGLTVESLIEALRERIDPAFLPRPLLLVDALPRNATGKLPREALQAALSRHGVGKKETLAGTTRLSIPADHPAFAGHFPGNPIVPGAVLLDEVLHAICAQAALDVSTCRISAVKFLSPLRPGQGVSVRYAAQSDVLPNRKFQFVIVSEERKIATGSLVIPAA